MRSAEDFSGKKIGLLTVIELGESKNGASWICSCECGNQIQRKASAIKKAILNGYKNTSCGCRKGGESPERTEAIRKGESFYFTGKPCKYGHIEKRRVIGKTCVECARLKDIETRSKRTSYHANYQKSRKEETRKIQERYREKNREKIRIYDSERRQLPEVKINRAKHQRARNLSKRAAGGAVNKSQIDYLFLKQKSMCASCNKKLSSFHVDHITPIALGGSSEIENLQILCRECNLKKGAKDPIDWANQNGRLL